MKRLTPMRAGWGAWRAARRRGLTIREAFLEEVADVAEKVVDERVGALLENAYERGYRDGTRDALQARSRSA